MAALSRFCKNILKPLSHDVDKSLRYGFAANMHAHTMGLHDGCFAITVDDQPRQVVAFAVH